MSAIDKAMAVARARRARVVLPELEEPRVAAAAERLRAEGLAEPVALAPADEAQLAALLAARPMKPELARRMLSRPLIRAAAMVAAGQADAMVAGASVPTRRVIEAAAIAIGTAEGVATPSSFFLMRLPDGRELIFADCAVNTDPDPAQLADIAVASARSAERLLGSARVAMLSYATLASGTGPAVDRVAEATRRAAAAGIDVVGPIQADAALNEAIARTKGLADPRPANVLVFPSLEAGNIGYKLVQELAGAQAVGPLLQGFRRPVCDLSRGARVDDIVLATALTVALGA